MYSVVVSDLDGTLLDNEHRLSSRTKEVVHRLSDQGVRFVLATGRHFLDVEFFCAQLVSGIYTITSNGARVHLPSGESLFSRNMSPSAVRALIEIGRKHPDVTVNIYTDNAWLVEQPQLELLDFHRDSDFSYTVTDFSNHALDGVCKVFFIADDHEHLLTVEQECQQALGDSVNMTFSLGSCFEVMAAGVSKGVALGYIAEREGWSRDGIVAFGDGMNDFEMLAGVGRGVVMGNAHQRLLASLPDNEVIGCNDEHAVADYLAGCFGLEFTDEINCSSRPELSTG